MTFNQVMWWFAVATVASVACQEQEQAQIEIVKQINRMNEDGSYTFGYEAADGSFKIETRDVKGNIKGMFGFIDENGDLKRVSYTANNGTGLQSGVEYTTVAPGGQPSTRRPSQQVIQYIPRRQVTTPVYGRRSTPRVTEPPEPEEVTPLPIRKLLVTKRPAGKGGNDLRRQLSSESETSVDAADVYSGTGGNPRYIPAQSVRSAQTPLLANLPPHVAAAIRQQQVARAAAALRSTAITEQEYPSPPVRDVYRSYPPGFDDGPTRIPFPMASLRSLRDELMDYILQYIQYRLNGGAPYPTNPLNPAFQNPMFNPNYPYQGPMNYPNVNPNLYNPYIFPGSPYARPPFVPPGYPQGPFGSGYPSSFSQPLPFSSPNKQQAPRSNTLREEQSSSAPSYSPPPADMLRLVLARGLPSSTTTAAPVRSVQILGAASSLSAASVPAPATTVTDEMEMQA